MDIKRSDLKLYARRALKGNWGVVIGATLISMGIAYLFTTALNAVLFAALRIGADALFGKFLSPVSQFPTGNVSAGTLVIVLIVLYFVYLVAMLLMSVGYQRLYLDVVTEQKGKVTTLFWAFTHSPWKFILISVLIALLEGITTVPIYIMSLAAALSGGSGFAAAFLLVYEIIFLIVYAYVLLTFSQFYLILVEDPQKGIFEALAESQRMMKGNRGRYFVLCLSFFGISLLAAFSFGLAALWLTPYTGCTFAMFYLGLKGQVPEKLKHSPAEIAAANASYTGPTYYQEQPIPQQGYYQQPMQTPPQDMYYQQPVQTPPQDMYYQQPAQTTAQDMYYQQPAQTTPQDMYYQQPAQASPQDMYYQQPAQTPSQESYYQQPAQATPQEPYYRQPAQTNTDPDKNIPSGTPQV